MASQKLSLEELEKKAKKIKLVALDMDGTLTDGSIYIGGDGELFKRFNAKDGLGITTAVRHGLRVAVITGRKGPIVQRRAEELGIADDLFEADGSFDGYENAREYLVKDGSLCGYLFQCLHCGKYYLRIDAD